MTLQTGALGSEPTIIDDSDGYHMSVEPHSSIDDVEPAYDSDQENRPPPSKGKAREITSTASANSLDPESDDDEQVQRILTDITTRSFMDSLLNGDDDDFDSVTLVDRKPDDASRLLGKIKQLSFPGSKSCSEEDMVEPSPKRRRLGEPISLKEAKGQN
ncbi:hypothetical protein FRB99_001681 [Tulasnella sp. 403]|nr:hypothetical protein FRB99_001681 [Tulasnella sp. 403]